MDFDRLIPPFLVFSTTVTRAHQDFHLRPNDERCHSPHRARSYHFVIAVWSAKEAESRRVKYWEIIADNLSQADWSWGCLSAIELPTANNLGC
ncbi:MAG: hypothetical protein DME85_00435 [Verrucomicrobia bacterium]|nr:MAG: hypothetical protein DME85_00435 [Verrucomicrobiota bacterium]